MDSFKPDTGRGTLANLCGSLQRRSFLTNTTAAAISIVGGHVASDPSKANSISLGPDSSTGGPDGQAPSSTLTRRRRIGSIGTGGRWNSVGRAAMEFGDLVALCDVDSRHLADAARVVEKRQGHQPQKFEHYQRLLSREDIDVVTIVTPDHWHAKMAIEAMRAGKDVYCEKPLTLTIDEGNRMIEVLEETGRILQVGTQQRTEFNERFLTAVALCQAQRLGRIKKAVCGVGGAPESAAIPATSPPEELQWDLWLGPAPHAEFRYAERPQGRPTTRGHYEFRWWYESSGGKTTDWGAHHVDIAQWAMGKTDTSPVAIHPLEVVHPVPLDSQGNPTDPSRYNTATKFLVSCEFADGTELEISSSAPNGILFVGEKGELFVSRNTLRGAAFDELANHPLTDELFDRLCKGVRPRGPHPHMRNFFESIERGTQPISDIYSHHRAITTCHLANIAMRLGRTIRWDPDSQKIIDDAVAESMQSRRPREGFELDS